MSNKEKSIPQKIIDAIRAGKYMKATYPRIRESEEELIRYEIDYVIWAEFNKVFATLLTPEDFSAFIMKLTGADETLKRAQEFQELKSKKE